MMKNTCEIVQDLLPLYRDNVCSASSREMVEKHLSECESCRKMLAQIEDNTCVQALQNECQDVIAHHNKQFQRKSVMISTFVAVIFAFPILVCLIINLATGHTLDWFFIVLTSLMVTASITVVPLAVVEKKFLKTLASFTGSLLLLLLSCCLYAGGDWFFTAAISILLVLSVLFLPIVLHQLPLNAPLSKHTGLISMAIDTLLLYTVFLTGVLYADSDNNPKTSFLITTICIAFVWFLFAIIRYTKLPALVKSGICVITVGSFIVFLNDIIQWILEGTLQFELSFADFSTWNNLAVLDSNLKLLLFILTLTVGLILIAAGFLLKINRNNRVKEKCE